MLTQLGCVCYGRHHSYLKENICDKLAVADGSFIGTTFKVEGKLENLTDYYRVKDFMDIVKEFRRECFYNY